MRQVPDPKLASEVPAAPGPNMASVALCGEIRVARLGLSCGCLSSVAFAALAALLIARQPAAEGTLALLILLVLIWFCTAFLAALIGVLAWKALPATSAARHRRTVKAAVILGVINLAILAVAFVLPLMVKAPAIPSKTACVNNLRQLDMAKQQWALEHRKTADDMPRWDDLVGTNKYVKTTPFCPARGEYLLGPLSVRPACSVLDHNFQLFESDPGPAAQLTCQQSLLLLHIAKQEWLRMHRGEGAPALKELLAYMRQTPFHPPELHCEAGGTFFVGGEREQPRCSVHGHTLR